MTWNGSTGVGLPTFVGFNTLVQGWLGVFILILVWAVIYYAQRNEPTREAVATASFVSVIVAVLLAILGLLPDRYLGMMIAIFIGSMVMLINRR